MKPRQLKKLSKKLVQIAPTIFQGAWIDGLHEVDDEQGGIKLMKMWCITHIDEAESCWQWWKKSYEWYGFDAYPEGHEREHWPNTEGFNPTTINLLKHARWAEEEEVERSNFWQH